jgi:hypothetical protein
MTGIFAEVGYYLMGMPLVAATPEIAAKHSPQVG